MTTDREGTETLIYSLHRDDERPFVFQGTMLATSKGRWCDGNEQQRWHDVAVYRSRNGQLVVHWEYITHQPGEFPHAAVEVNSTVEETAIVLKTWDPTPWVGGSHGTPTLRDHEGVLMDILARYDRQVTEILQTLGVSETGFWAWSG